MFEQDKPIRKVLKLDISCNYCTNLNTMKSMQIQELSNRENIIKSTEKRTALILGLYFRYYKA